MELVPISSTEDEINYTPLDEDGIQPLGNLTIETIHHLGKGEMETNTVGIDPTTIKMTYIDYEFWGVQQIAVADSFRTDYASGNIEIRLNESVRYDYWENDSLTLLNYKSELARGEIIEMYINSTPIDDISKVEKSSAGGFNYNYSEYHNANPKGSLIVDYVFDYNVTMRYWRLLQKRYPSAPEKTPFITKNQAEIISYYNYTWQMGDFNVDLIVDLILNIPDITYLRDLEWKKTYSLTNTTVFTGYTQLVNSSFRLANLPIDAKTFTIDFVTNHTIEIANKFSDYWRKDYLVNGRNERVRLFDISVIEGPPSILVSNFLLNLTEVHFNEFIDVSSNFGRSLTFHNMWTEYGRKTNGTTIEFFGGEDYLASDYYLVLGETDVISITYRASSSLQFTVVDKINNPLRNAEVILYFGNATYGTYISEDLSIPYAAKITDGSGIITLDEVPRGNFLVDVVYKGQLVADKVAIDTEADDYVISTSVPHFPIWMITFAGFSSAIGIIGYVIFKKAKI
ncbi:MAG: hypothetical protein JW776_00265 [Candidatus Lokiarchaeota archaeon]|nr:hypothetical protein [Candidatus Lokiarchaeota archaeon]